MAWIEIGALEAMSIFIPHILIFLSGLIFSPRAFSLRFSLVSRVAISYLTGELVFIIFFVLSSLLVGIIFWNGSFLFAAFGLSTFLWRTLMSVDKSPTRASSTSYKTIGLLVLQILLIILNFANFDTSFLLPAVAWDARSIWLFHGKMFYYANALDVNALKNPAYLWSHPSYPPFIPLFAAFHSQFLDGWNETLSKSFLFIHWISTSIIFAQLLFLLCEELVVVGLASVLVQLVFSNNCHIAYADSCCAVALCSAVIGFALILKDDLWQDKFMQQFCRWIAVLNVALATLMKNEGLLFGVLIYLVYLVFHVRTVNNLKAEIKCICLVLVAILPWHFLLWYNQIVDEYSTYGYLAVVFKLNWAELFERTNLIIGLGLDALIQEYGIIVSLIFYSSVILSFVLQPFYSDRSDRYLFVMITLLAAVLLPIYFLTPLDLGWHIQTSFARVASTSIILGCVLICRIARQKYEDLYL